MSTIDDPRRAEARRLRAEEGLSVSQIAERIGVGVGVAGGWVRGLPIPEWTRRPRAKDAQRARALELRRQGGWSANRIAVEVGVSQSTAYQWTKHIPLDPTPEAAAERRRSHSAHMQESRWEPYRQARDAERAAAIQAEVEWVNSLSEREAVLAGVTTYWAEGQKSKPHDPNRCRLQLTNSDPALIMMFLRLVRFLGVERPDMRFRLSIHESADVPAVTRWWADILGLGPEDFERATLKKHKPNTVRHNVKDDYHGCLVVSVLMSRKLYWRVEGMMRGIALAVESSGDAKICRTEMT